MNYIIMKTKKSIYLLQFCTGVICVDYSQNCLYEGLLGIQQESAKALNKPHVGHVISFRATEVFYSCNEYKIVRVGC